jgi:hypothetical protein
MKQRRNADVPMRLHLDLIVIAVEEVRGMRIAAAVGAIAAMSTVQT